MQDAGLLKDIQAVVLDMDGVLWRGSTPQPGLVELFDFFRAKNLPFIFATNNSTNTLDVFVQKLAGMGVQIEPHRLVTSAVATVEYLKASYQNGVRVHLLGEAGLFQLMLEAGFPSVMVDADVVVVGLDRDVTYEKLRRATYMINDGARFIGTNGDLSFPMPDGLAPGAGSILASLQASTGQEPFVIGKPEPIIFEMALAQLGTVPEHTLMVGDRLETDILGAQRADLKTALLWSGVTTPEILAASDIQPDVVFDDIVAMRQAWETVF